MDHYILVTMDVPHGDGVTPASEVVDALLRVGCWAFSDSAPVKQQLDKNDRVLIYVGGKGRHHFVATCTVDGTIRDATDEQTELLSSLGLGFMRKVLPLRETERMSPPVELKPLLHDLAFIKDKKNYGLSLRLPVRRIPDWDYQLICREGAKK